jgi:hypothetical protein
MQIDISNLEKFQKGNANQKIFQISPTDLRTNLGEVLDRVLYCIPKHTAYVVRRGKLIAIMKMPEVE